MRAPTERIVKKNRYISPMEEIRILARNTRNEETLDDLAKKYSNDFDTCKYLINNGSLPESAKYVLACSENIDVKRLLAQSGENILSTQTQLRLVLCEDKIVKEHLARTTTKEEIKELLFKSNPENYANEKIRGYCLKRMHNMDLIERFILTSTQDILDKYSDMILSNRHLSIRVLNFFVLINTNLTDKEKKIIQDHPCFDPRKIDLP